MEERRCIRCGVTKPETAEFFTKHSKSPKGLLSTCKLCKQEEERAHYAANPDLFRRRGRESHARNREARNAAKHIAYLANPEPAKARARARVLADPERKRQEDAAWRADPENRETNRLKCLKWVEEHREITRERARQWGKDNPDRVRAQGHAKRARKRNAPGTHTAEDVLRLYNEQEGRCYYCNVDLDGNYHVEHKTPLSRGGGNGVENICCACSACNLAKHAMTESEFRQSCLASVQSTQNAS